MSVHTRSLNLIKDVTMNLTVELGRVDMKLADVLALREDAVISLNRLTEECLDVFVNGKLIARGEIVSEGNHFGLRIVEIIGGDGSPEPDAL